MPRAPYRRRDIVSTTLTMQNDGNFISFRFSWLLYCLDVRRESCTRRYWVQNFVVIEIIWARFDCGLGDNGCPPSGKNSNYQTRAYYGESVLAYQHPLRACTTAWNHLTLIAGLEWPPGGKNNQPLLGAQKVKRVQLPRAGSGLLSAASFLIRIFQWALEERATSGLPLPPPFACQTAITYGRADKTPIS